MSIKVLVCGGRDYQDRAAVFSALDLLATENGGIRLLIQGGATGADELAAHWARARAVPCLNVPANWEKYGKAAGPIRNTAMLGYRPDVVLAFPGGKGTANMVDQARLAGVKVEVFP
jgi:hypothetical protein